MPAYEGMIVRNQALDHVSAAALQAALTSGEAVPMKTFVNNAKSVAQTIPKPGKPFIAAPKLPGSGGPPPPPPGPAPNLMGYVNPKPKAIAQYSGPNVLAASPGGFKQFSSTSSAKFVIKSITGRYITPLSESLKPEVLICGGGVSAAGAPPKPVTFKMFAKKVYEEATVWLLEEI